MMDKVKSGIWNGTEQCFVMGCRAGRLACSYVPTVTLPSVPRWAALSAAPPLRESEKVEEDKSGSWGSMPYIAIGAGLGAVAAPAALTAVGFTGAGIAAGSLAASMMKASAIFYGGGVPAGGVVATLQSLGATAGFSYIGAGAAGAAGYAYHKITSGGE